MKIDRCKGFKDISPPQMARFRLIEAVFRDACLKWGYQEVRTPTLEYLYLFTSVGTLTPAMLRRVYSFLDWDGWSGERVVLKPDGTIPVARFYVDRLKKGLARLFYVTNVFMFEETGKKSREKWQCGVELIGENSTVADSELVSMALDVLRRLGLTDISLKVSHAGLIRALLDKLELDPEEQNRIFDRILDGDSAALAAIKPDKPVLVEALTLLSGLKGRSPGFLENIKALSTNKLPELKPALDNFISVAGLLEKLGCGYSIDMASGKGFEYYTGIIFHLYCGQQLMGGGGRYDNLIPQMGGRDTAAAGFALYMDSLMELIEQDNLAEQTKGRVLVRIETGAEKEGFDIAALLREAGFIVELALNGQPMAKCDWYLEVNNESPIFTLTNQADNKKSSTDSAAGVLAIMGCGEDVS
jgi:histidyl-tRNA synthetase